MEPPYGGIWSRLKAGKVIPFLGAGASLVGRPAGAAWNPEQPEFLPSGADLAQFLADEANLPKSDDPRDPRFHDRFDLAKVSSYYAGRLGRPALGDKLCEVLRNAQYRPGPLHEFLVRIPTPQVIVSTNYDTLLEQAFRAAGRPYDLVVYLRDQPDVTESVLWWRHGEREPVTVHAGDLVIDLASTSVIYKMHGSVEPRPAEDDSFVITEDDYVDYLAQIETVLPPVLRAHFQECSFLFLGYGLRDWNLRVILKNLSASFEVRTGRGSRAAALPSWAIQRAPSPIEQVLWSKRGVDIFDVDLDEFVRNLSRRLAS